MADALAPGPAKRTMPKSDPEHGMLTAVRHQCSEQGLTGGLEALESLEAALLGCSERDQGREVVATIVLMAEHTLLVIVCSGGPCSSHWYAIHTACIDRPFVGECQPS